jgi:Zn-dependent protease
LAYTPNIPAMSFILQNLPLVIVLVLSLSVHEWAHAYSAFRLGDDTAKQMGRLTLNPISHIDFVGTLLLPMLGVPFGWAKPVPVNPARFDPKLPMNTGMMITAGAGPFSNVVLALLCILLLGVMHRFLLSYEALTVLLIKGFQLNVVLALFNMLPIPPLDGSRIAEGLLPRRMLPAWERFARFSPLALLAIIFVLPQMGFHVLSWPVHQANRMAEGLLYAIQSIGS